MILSPEELLTALPSLRVTEAEAQILIVRSQAIAEGFDGANRSLLITQYTEDRQLTFNGCIRLANYPVIDSAPITIKVKQESIAGYYGAGGGVSLSGGWQELKPDEFVLDPSIGEVEIFQFNDSRYVRDRTAIGIRRRPLTKLRSPRVRISYSAGYDFTTPDHEIKKMKAALIGMIEVLTTSNAMKGIKSLTSDEDRIDFFSPDVFQNSKYLDFLAIFRKYRPRGVI